MRKPAASTTTKTILQARVGVVSLLFLLSSFSFLSPSKAGGPTDQVRATVESALAIVRNPGLKSEGQRKNLRAQLTQAIYPRFDFTEMAKRSLGSHWGRRTAGEQREFVKIFAELLGNFYVDRIESYTSQDVLYTREVEDGNYAEVATKIVTDNSSDEVSINYKLHRVYNEWRVYDLAIDISLVNNYRSQFDRVIARSSFENLVRVLQEKQSKNSERVGPVNSAGRPGRSSISASLTRILLKNIQD
jgi:phospholipid transport system substrate-binding protein